MSHDKPAQHETFTIGFTGIAHVARKELDMTGPRLNPIVDIEIEGVQIRFYRGGLPVNLAADIARLYRNVFSSMEKLEADGLLDQAECYVSKGPGGIQAILLFARKDGTVTVLNSAFALAAAQMEVFCKAAFCVYPDARRIRFEAVQCDLAGITMPHQRFDCLENIVATLPASVPEYLASLGKGMRASIKRNKRKLETQVNGFAWQIHEGADISRGDVEALIALSSARVNSKNMKSSHTDVKTRHLFKLLKNAGSVLVARINGEICGGVICTAYGGNYYMHVVAHDAAYRAFSLGKVCIFLSIAHAIENGAREYQFLWGAYPYKFDFLGVQRNYDRIVIYRSALWMALSPRLFIHVALRGIGRRARIWLSHCRRQLRTEIP